MAVIYILFLVEEHTGMLFLLLVEASKVHIAMPVQQSA